jgi:hypothetical protein
MIGHRSAGLILDLIQQLCNFAPLDPTYRPCADRWVNEAI